METKKIFHCDLCNIDITIKNYSRHINSKKYNQSSTLKNNEFKKWKEWAEKNYIYNHENLTEKELRKIKKFNKEDYNLFSNIRLNEIGEKLYVRNLHNINKKN